MQLRFLVSQEALGVLDLLLDEALEEEEIDIKDPKVLQQELRKALIDSEADEEGGAAQGGSDEYIWFEDFTDEFARMSLMLYHDMEGMEDDAAEGALAPEYADVTLDNECRSLVPSLRVCVCVCVCVFQREHSSSPPLPQDFEIYPCEDGSYAIPAGEALI